MPRPFRCVVTLVIALLGCAVIGRAESLTTLKSGPLAPTYAARLTVAFTAPPLPPLLGVAEGFAAQSAVRHDNALWLLARDAAGQPALLRHDAAGGWQRRAAPPAGLASVLNPGGQAHLLAIGLAADGAATVYSYHTITDRWATIGTVAGPAVGATAAPAANGFILTAASPTGPPVHTLVAVALTKRLIGWIDWSIVVVYLVATAGIGLYFYIKDKQVTNEEFFLGSRNIPWWAAGFSLYATGTSAISFIAIPAKSFATNWLYLAANFIGLIGTVFVAIWIVPLIRRLNLMSVYQYLELRFHPNIRVLASGLSITLQLGGRMSIVLFLPSLAMAAVTGLDVVTSILIMGLVTIVYTMMGGMKAVIWTDVIQVVVMLGGALFAIVYVVTQIDGGFGEFFRTALADGKLQTFDWSFDLTKATVWGFLLVVILGVLTYPQDQVMMQRVLSTKSDKEAGWSVWMLSALIIPGSVTFFAIGTALYVFYKANPARLNPLLSIDSTFPQFIAAELPVGVVGLMIAGVFAASMSTLSSCISSVATMVSVDFYERFAKKPTQAGSVYLAKWMVVVAGLIGVGTALILASTDMKSALDRSFELTALFGGGFAGCYGLGLFTRRANWQGATTGVVSSILITSIAWSLKLVHPYFYGVIAISSCMIVGYAASWLFPAPRQSLLGLTVYTPRSAPVSPA